MKEVIGLGQILLGQAAQYVKALETRASLKSDVNELKSNIFLITQLEKGYMNLEKEKQSVEDSLTEYEPKLEALQIALFDFQQFSSAFGDSPPLPDWTLIFLRIVLISKMLKF